MASIRAVTFSIGIIPLFGLALFGSGLEVFGHQVCPRGDNGTPLCFYSFAVAVGLIAAFFIVQLYDQPARVAPDKRHSQL
jgi:hypothetical protein